MGNLTKRDLVVHLSEETGLSQNDVSEFLMKTLNCIVENLAKGNDVELRNFGVFQVRLSKPRVGRNPNVPDSTVAIPSRATVKFKPGKQMRQKVLVLSGQLKKNAAKAAKPAKVVKTDKATKPAKAVKSVKKKVLAES